MEEPKIDAEKARGGKIILRRRWQRVVFVGGLVAFVLFLIFARFIGSS